VSLRTQFTHRTPPPTHDAGWATRSRYSWWIVLSDARKAIRQGKPVITDEMDVCEVTYDAKGNVGDGYTAPDATTAASRSNAAHVFDRALHWARRAHGHNGIADAVAECESDRRNALGTVQANVELESTLPQRQYDFTAQNAATWIGRDTLRPSHGHGTHDASFERTALAKSHR
jgi:hypothetical protein